VSSVPSLKSARYLIAYNLAQAAALYVDRARIRQKVPGGPSIHLHAFAAIGKEQRRV
jgi:hypothetical protein